ncbi:serine/threonine protein phosphatase [Hymenobacter taeanensis]|uniref:Serine/threonine protein phosphatase n=1 Tax=Hymenobacter taeanensis TaxID=2735321 RepID=A0A6M6BFZ4_9BACT|nr:MULTISPECIES: metallophosphoesterase family protein [Hymenobacter]QJX46758.1 serine/threonine protein phosphatase [Hymenobacter taeanensis]UOQ80626.1 serine/threonine protein phosphatase [Hymenobacter sp. 5414T-23]
MARYATTDIHGCLLSFRHLVEEKLKLTPQDELYVLGDYVNKGPDSRGVLDYLMRLPDRGYQVVCLRGNHDQELLDAARGLEHLTWASADDRALTLQSFGVSRVEDIPAPYLCWLDDLPYQFELPDFVLVHAGFNFRLPPAEMRRDWHTMLNTKEFVMDASRLGGKRLLHGHVPTPTSTVQQRAEGHAQAIGLDTGCVYRHNPELSHLAALNLDTFALTLQPNMEEPYEIAKR